MTASKPLIDPSMDSMPLISVIVAVYNGAPTLQQCLDSVNSQSYARTQLIVVDGASKDGSAKIIESNQHKIDYWVSEPDRGIYDAWNKGLAQARGDWICFIGSDDYLWDSSALRTMANQLVRVPLGIRVVYGQIMLLDSQGRELHAIGKPWNQIQARFKELMCLPHPAVMHRKDLFAQHGNFDAGFRIAGDYDLLLRELKQNDALFLPDIVVTAMRQGGISSNPGNNLKALREVRSAQLKNGLHTPGWAWRLAMARSYVSFAMAQVLGVKLTRAVLNAVKAVLAWFK